MASLVQRMGDWWRRRSLPKPDSPVAEAAPAPVSRRWRTWRPILIALAVFLALYYPIGMIWVHKIDDDTAFRASDVKDSESHAIAVTAALIHREVDQQRWTANDPWFLPPAALDNMPNFQQGIIAGLSRFAIEMLDQIGRTRGSSQADPDLQKAAGLLKYPGTVWVINPEVSWWVPTASSERQYRSARERLLEYNRRLAEGNAVFDRRADNLLGTLDRVASDLGSASASLDGWIRERSGSLIDFGADDLFYNIKGRTYAYYLLLDALAIDFDNVIRDRELGSAWTQLLASMQAAAQLDPWVIVNGAPDSQFLPSHLAAQGFYLLRARTQLREISNILLK
ncbi:MAG: DUF2333 family protein [Alphaproteobacteria bacterium]|nr:DUF2333 family protein [Alphaproteobacteria bacterium]